MLRYFVADNFGLLEPFKPVTVVMLAAYYTLSTAILVAIVAALIFGGLWLTVGPPRRGKK